MQGGGNIPQVLGAWGGAYNGVLWGFYEGVKIWDWKKIFQSEAKWGWGEGGGRWRGGGGDKPLGNAIFI